MTLKFREDEDLFVLALSRHEDLERLAGILTLDAVDGQRRHAQELLKDPEYKRAVDEGDLRKAWKPLAAELQAYGGDSIANAMRSLVKGHTGVLYREIVTDLCGHLKIEIKPAEDIKALEDQLLVAMLSSQKKNFSGEELHRIIDEAAMKVGLSESPGGKRNFDDLIHGVSTDAQIAYLAAIVAPLITSAVAPSLACLTLPVALAVAAPRVGAAFVPGLNVVSAVSALKQITSPAYRVTLPAVLEVIRIRRHALLATLSEERFA
ncbi:hypothetical protein CKY39_07900 [Variovorax boronicumulans]|uniref:DUF3944 domain-containing protein n=1 Tax=Variovorax boronicumulans TaxID=436515 RepID=A0A250DG79_9BURK|nr:hypothetical protein [Variovorax boronicumulans]ATA53141.1 hypothetical protein CKY39_07900 [Variovorax boronicumulans]